MLVKFKSIVFFFFPFYWYIWADSSQTQLAFRLNKEKGHVNLGTSLMSNLDFSTYHNQILDLGTFSVQTR